MNPASIFALLHKYFFWTVQAPNLVMQRIVLVLVLLAPVVFSPVP